MSDFADIADDQAMIESRLAALTEEHRDLDSAIGALQGASMCDMMQVQRLKKRKLMLKDQIGKLENMLIPDIIA